MPSRSAILISKFETGLKAAVACGTCTGVEVKCGVTFEDGLAGCVCTGKFIPAGFDVGIPQAASRLIIKINHKNVILFRFLMILMTDEVLCGSISSWVFLIVCYYNPIIKDAL
jgi:hypothetical protein